MLTIRVTEARYWWFKHVYHTISPAVNAALDHTFPLTKRELSKFQHGRASLARAKKRGIK